jgi:hypothetical protein
MGMSVNPVVLSKTFFSIDSLSLKVQKFKSQRVQGFEDSRVQGFKDLRVQTFAAVGLVKGYFS